MLIDSHTHVVSPDEVAFPRRPSELANGAWWEGADHSVQRLAAQVGASPVDGVVVVQAAGPYGDDNAYLIEALRHDPTHFVGACIVDPTSGQGDAVERLRAAARHEGVGGVRLFHIPRPTEPWLAGSDGDRLIDEAADLGLSVAVCCLADDLAAVGTQLARRPDVDIVIDHCGFADFSDGPPFESARPLWDLLEHINLHVKFTPTIARIAGGDPALLLEHLVASFGATRVLWGSDWPQHRELVDGRRLEYAEQVALIGSWGAALSDREQAAVYGENAQRLWPDSWPHVRVPGGSA